ncbi:MAG: hypothetical protein FWE36_04500 [Erysipelotrichales bacterium]|nr:hypothetical protein [Erysipelotrichales bacterium]
MSRAERSLKILENDKLLIIKFPVGILWIIIYLVAFALVISIPFVFREFFMFPIIIIAYIFLPISVGLHFVLRFFREITINYETRTVTYRSLGTRHFNFDEIYDFQILVKEDVDWNEKSYLCLRLKDNRKIEIKANSRTQMIGVVSKLAKIKFK